ncbi:B3 domain-containing protein/Auxin_resp domain-containing protein [Cephalotus follicularis]|uniref:Auxin response factor n=1 Tax=Cephalotus follicularis TaxID=3775 RepID=A0A1Q3AUA1_CEPFO|nr:B3 domain-containing protein/Auxin_resp domain-containing protein [Cephalotus follicularis]
MPPSQPQQPLSTTVEPSHVDPRIWRACGGISVQIPVINSRVYYFPQGHVEQSFGGSANSPSPTIFSPLALTKPFIPCSISAVHLLADPITDEVFTKLVLLPIDPSRGFQSLLVEQGNPKTDGGDGFDDDEKINAFSKILTPSDANNGGGFSVPRFCADSIFPPLDLKAEPPVQTLSITDIHGSVWEFRHIYRGTPRRHLLTTGWSKFVNSKKLIAGDSVVFMRSSMGEMFIGVRRAAKLGNGGDCNRWRDQVRAEEARRVTADAVVEATERAAQGLPFEVVYYPRTGWSDFVVKAEVVESALSVFWTAGMRVKMSMETDDSARLTWFQGTVASAMLPESGPWCGSPWRMLQVTWDEPEVMHNVKRVNPWQVDFVAPAPPIHTQFPPAKKHKFPQNYELMTDGEGETYYPTPLFNNSTIGHTDLSLLNYNTFPAGMQGARHDRYSLFSLTDFVSNNTAQLSTDYFFGSNMVPKSKSVSTELNIGSSQSESLSPDSSSSVNRSVNSTKVGASTFQLFGKTIRMKEPVEGGFDDVGCMQHAGRKGFNENEDVKNPLGLSLTCPYNRPLDRLDVQCQRSPTVEACSL